MNRDVSVFGKSDATATTGQIAAVLFEDRTTPSQAAMRDETRRMIEKALGQMDPLDQEVLALRHFEQLSSVDFAALLGIETSAASKRFVGALQRLKSIVDGYGTDCV